MKVVIPVASLETGGGCKLLADIGNALQAKGHETEIVIPDGAPLAYQIKCKLTKVPSLQKRYIPYGDIVLPNFYTTFAPAYRAWPTRCVRLCQGFEPLWLDDNRFALKTYRKRVPIISLSKWLDDQIFNFTKKRGVIVNPGINPQIFYPDAKQEQAKKNRWQKVILYIARDPKLGYAVKGYEEFVKAMEIFHKTYNGDYIVHMICPETILPLPGIPHQTFVPSSNSYKMAQLYRQADLFVSTSRMEGFGLPPLEAMGCRTPVVTTNSGGVSDFCQHLKTAYMTEPGDPKGIAAGMVEVLSKPALAESLKKGGQEPAARLTEQRFENQMVRVLEELNRNMS